MKIVVVGTRGIPGIQGGIETYCQELYPRLVEFGCEVTLITRKPYVLIQKKDYKGVKLIHLFAPKIKSLEAITHTFLGVLVARRLNPDILHIHAIGPSIFTPFAKWIGLKVVITNQGPDYDRKKWGRFAKFVLKLGEKWGTRYADKVIVVSSTIKNILDQKYNRCDCELIPNGVYLPKKTSNSAYIESIDLVKQKYIIAVGRFVPEKGFDDLIKAYQLLNNPSYRLVLVGDADHDTEYSRNLKSIAKKHGVILTGFINGDKLNQIYSHAALFILPSYHEGLSLALLEALGYGLNVLLSDIPANKEIEFEPDCYFPVGDVNTLAKALADKINTIENNSVNYDNILENYSWSVVAQKTYTLYENIYTNETEQIYSR